MSKKLRIVRVVVHPEVVIDDGENLTLLDAQPITVNPSDWPDFPAKLAEQMVEQEAAMNAEDEEGV